MSPIDALPTTKCFLELAELSVTLRSGSRTRDQAVCRYERNPEATSIMYGPTGRLVSKYEPFSEVVVSASSRWQSEWPSRNAGQRAAAGIRTVP